MDDKRWIVTTCKIGQRAECCKYLIAGSNGFECAKTNLELKTTIDIQWSLHHHVAQGDNCDGITDQSILNT